nr:hypothetical protein [Burkholderia cenocepacia]
MRDPSAPFRIAAARARSTRAMGARARASRGRRGCWIAAGWAATLARVLLPPSARGRDRGAVVRGSYRIETGGCLPRWRGRGRRRAVDDGSRRSIARSPIWAGSTRRRRRTLDARVRGAVGVPAAVLVAIVQWLVVGIAIAVSPIG